jgi:DNA-binding transcriptional regulator PaaX
MMIAEKTVKKAPRKERPVLVSCLAAQVLGHSRVAIATGFTIRQMTTAFPAFNEFELSHALSELVDKHLVTQKGQEEKAVYSLTDQGRTGRVGVS